jgi:D-xylose 1-dehydrogenase
MTHLNPALAAQYPSLAGRRVVITGGASGIGAGFVEAFVRQGAEVRFLDVMTVEGAALAERLAGEPSPPQFLPCDLCDIGALERVFAEIGAIDVLINNAASDDRHGLADVTEDYFQNRMAVNLRHLLFASKYAAADMRKRRTGVIINLGSISWHLGLPDLVLYETAKAGIEGMTRALARELGPEGVRVVCIVPGNVKTPRQMRWYTPEGEAEIVSQQCLKARIEPADVAALALFLASDDARMLTGHSYFVDAGWR